MTVITLKVEGMSCGHCTQAVTRAIEAVQGVTGVQVSLERQEAVVDGPADIGQLVQAVRDAGYAARPGIP